MDITYLKEFVALSRIGSFEETAAMLYTTQSTLSKHIKKMENDLGVTLFERSARHFRITEAGQSLLPYATQIEELEKQYLATLSALKRDDAHRIRIGMKNVSSYRIHRQKLTDVFLQFQAQHPGSEVVFSSGSVSDVYEQLLKGQVDFGILYQRDKTDMSAFLSMPIAEDRIVAVCSRRHPLASRKAVTMQELKGEKILLNAGKSFVRDYMEDLCKAEGLEVPMTVQDGRLRDMIELAALDMGIYFCMKKPARELHNSNIVLLDLDPPCTCRIALCCSKKNLSGTSREFWDYMTGILQDKESCT